MTEEFQPGEMLFLSNGRVVEFVRCYHDTSAAVVRYPGEEGSRIASMADLSREPPPRAESEATE